jgi:Fe-S cluster assembly protein SufB
MTRATEDRIYFDHNATAPLRPEAKAAMLAAMEQVGNPSSVHAEGRRARAIVERAREQVAGLVGAKPSEVVFTSGATESNNWVLRAGWDAIVVAGIEHDSVLAPARASGSRIVEIGTHSDGIVDTCAIADHVLLGNGPLGRDLVTLQMANSETGVLQDVGAVSDFCAAHGVAMHTDAVQAPGRVPIDFAGLGVTFLSLSAHKLGAPKGIGALIIRDGVELPGGFAGGGQELRRRAGTENVTAIAGFGAAAEAAQRDLDDVARVAEMRDRLQREMVEIVLGQEIDVDKYKYGFETMIESDMAPKGLSEEVIRFISAKKEEPEWMLEQRLEAYQRWLKMDEPTWAKVSYPKIDFNDIYYYAAPKGQTGPKSLDEVDPELLATYAKLGIPLKEQEILAGVRKQGEPSQLDEDGGPSYASGNVAVDAVFDSVSVVTTFKKELAKAGVIFCSISEAIREHPELVKKYLFSVVPQADNFYAALNSAVFTDGSFVYIPEGVRCPMELSTYFRINAENTGQFERTLIIAEKGSYVSYLEGCTAPMRDENQLHAAVVELVALEDAEIKYSTVQNWYPGDKDGKGGIYNFVTKRADCRGNNSKVSWTQVETGSAVTWKYPSCILRGDNSRGEFYSIAISNGYQQVDSGTKMIHLGKNTTSRIISKGIAAGHSDNTYRGIVSTHPKAKNARNFTLL